ncbi:MAG TPA: undecaprenyldiphospho-muramoylpentapeptide beta-N-acetylglucosaminyltransferase [Bacilli bacterium]
MRIVLSGGGTGGHIYPAIAIGKQCQKAIPGAELLYIGTETGLEKEIVEKHGIPFSSIDITGFRRKLFTPYNVKTVLKFLSGVKRCKRLLREFKPDAVVGTGGFVCGPVVYAASRLGIPTLIHEQNVIPGLTNKFLSRYATVVAVSFKGSEKHFRGAAHAVYTGNPSASQVAHVERGTGFKTLGIPQGARLILITGGSRGARALNEAALKMIPLLDGERDTYVVWVTGKVYYDDYKNKFNGARYSEHIKIVPYLHNMPEILSAATLVVSRAGASFLAEVTALGIPSVLVPSPNVTNNHQEANARWLKREHAAEIILEKDLTGKTLFQAVHALINDEALREKMAANSRKLGQPDAASLVVEQLLRISK